MLRPDLQLRALEPFTSWPPAGVVNAIQNGTALVLKPHQEIEPTLAAAAYEGDGVSRITQAGVVQPG